MERELVPVIVILFLFLVSMVSNYILNKKIEIKYSHLIDVKIEKLHTLHLLTEDISNRQRYMINMLLVSDKAEQTDLVTRVKESQVSSDKLLEYLEILYDEQGETKLMQPLRKQYQAYQNLNTLFTELALKGSREKALELNKNQMRPVYEGIQTNLRDLSNMATEKAEQIAKDATADIDFARKIILFIGLLPFGIWLAMLLWVFSYLGWQKLAGPGPRDDY